MYNFNDHIQKELVNRFGGSERKKTIILDDGNQYLLKIPDPIREKNNFLSYINNAFSEYIGCKIAKALQLPVQDVILGEYETLSSSGDLKTYVACACKNLENNGYYLAEAQKSTLSSEEATKAGQNPSFLTLEIIANCVSDISLEEIQKFYAEQFVFDAFIGNTDRHNGNWGFLISDKKTMLSPIYDCGSGLCPLYSDQQLTDRLAITDAINGMSAILDNDGKRIKYSDFLMSCENNDINNALQLVVPRIDLPKISKIITDITYISDVRKEFYCKFLEAKYTKILVPSLKRVCEKKLEITDQADLSLSDEELYKAYRNVIIPLKEIPLYSRKSFVIANNKKDVIHADHNQFIIVDSKTHIADVVISGQSKHRAIRKSLSALLQACHLPIYETCKIQVKQYQHNSKKH